MRQDFDTAYEQLSQHVYSFDWQQGRRFTDKNTTYKYMLGSKTADGYIEQQANIFRQNREIAIIIDRWQADRSLTKYDSIRQLYLPKLYDLQDRVWSVVSRDTILYLIDAENITYRDIMKQTYKLIAGLTITCFALGNILVFLFWRIRRKIF